MSDSLKERAVSGMAWRLWEKITTQLIQFIIQIIIAIILLPEEYGLVGLLTVFIALSDVFIFQGFTSSLIQKKEVDDLDYSSVFFTNILLSVVIYFCLFFVAPYVALFYGNPLLQPLMRVLSVNVLIGSFSSVHIAILTRNLDFKKSFTRNLCNVIAQGVVGIGLAINGFGEWSLVFSKLAGTLAGTVVLCMTIRWKLNFKISMERIKALFSFGSRILATNLLNTFFNNLNSLVIGKVYTSAELGYYQRGQQIPQTVMVAIDGSFNDVLYPTLSSVQDDLKRIKSALRKSMGLSMYIVLPLMLGLMATAEPLVRIILREKWVPCVPFLQLQCVICIFWPLSARVNALNALGHSDVTLKISIIGKVLTLFSIIITVKYGIYAIMLGMILVSFINMLISSYYVDKNVGYSLKELMMDIFPSFMLSLAMFFAVLLIGKLLKKFLLIKIISQIVIGLAVYGAGSILLKIESFIYYKNIAKKMMGKWRSRRN